MFLCIAYLNTLTLKTKCGKLKNLCGEKPDNSFLQIVSLS